MLSWAIAGQHFMEVRQFLKHFYLDFFFYEIFRIVFLMKCVSKKSSFKIKGRLEMSLHNFLLELSEFEGGGK